MSAVAAGLFTSTEDPPVLNLFTEDTLAVFWSIQYTLEPSTIIFPGVPWFVARTVTAALAVVYKKVEPVSKQAANNQCVNR